MPRKPAHLEKAYTGDLKKRIRKKQSPTAPTILERAISPDVDYEKKYKQELAEFVYEQNTFFMEERFRKLDLLFDHYDIDRNNPDRWFLLSMKLAINHVDGFWLEEDAQSGGAPTLWDDRKLALLYFEVQKLIISKGSKSTHNPNWACGQLAKNPKWNSTQKTLANKHSKATSSLFVKLYLNIIETEPFKNDVPETIDFFLESLKKHSQ